ncbi:MAG: DinB family protein [Ignavibacteriaceae bacterium]
MEIYPSIKDRLNSQHLAIKELIKNLDEEFINRRPETGKWSIQENLVHIVSYHQVFLKRIDKIIKNDNPYFERYRAEDDVNFNKLQKLISEELLILLEEERNKVTDLVFKLNINELQKPGTHQKFGVMNVVEWIEFFLLHEAYHIYTIFKLSKMN